VFNLLPAFPMDGGRVLRAVLATKLPRAKATRIAAWTGSIFSALFVAAGILSGNLILALVGVFVWSGAWAEAEQETQVSNLAGLSVRDVMTPVRVLVEGSDPIVETAATMARLRVTALPVELDGEYEGIVALRQVELLKPAERENSSTLALTDRRAPRLDADLPLVTALEKMAARDVEEAPVFLGEELVGLIEASDLGRALRLRRVAKKEPRRTFSFGVQPEAERA